VPIKMVLNTTLKSALLRRYTLEKKEKQELSM
jgi:hypothetical protein